MGVLFVLLLFLTCFQSGFAKKDPSDLSRYKQGNITNEKLAVDFLDSYNSEASKRCNELVKAEWNYASNLTEANKDLVVRKRLEHAGYLRDVWLNTTSFAWKNFTDPRMKRQFKLMSILGTAALMNDKLAKYESLSTDMESMYETAKICEYTTNLDSESLSKRNCNLTLEPDLTRIMATVDNYDELKYVWLEWREVSGKLMRDKYKEFVNLSNEMAALNGFKDTASYWLSGYDDEEIDKEFEMLWDQVRPLYQQLHAYVRRKLIEKFGIEHIQPDGPIPAHILGNMWAQSWTNIYNFSLPYPGKETADVTEAMIEQNYTPLKMFQMADDFFVSLGLTPMPPEFWNNSIIEKPNNREIICHASAWDFCDGRDFRIKQCTDTTMNFFEVTHHEMGHVQYYLQYKDQPLSFREGANPGFHEAVGDLMALSVSTPKHLSQIGLMGSATLDNETDINFLYRRALSKIAFLPYGYLIDKWRWGVFRGDIPSDQWNKYWWNLRLQYQGIVPPILRTEEDFDPGAKYHVPANVEYSRYFIASILQFQFHKVLCDVSRHYGPLHQCDIYKSRKAGDRIRETLKLGSSKPWPEVLSIMTANRATKMDAAPLMEYFEPLYKWLIKANANETVGWRV